MMDRYPDGMSGADMDYVEGVGMGECSEPMCDYQAGDDGLCDDHADRDEEGERQAFTSASLSRLHRLMDDGRGPE